MSEPFFALRPTPVSDVNFVSSNVPENDHPVYANNVTYGLGALVIVTTGYHRIYQSREANNLGNFPPTSPLKWTEVGPTNRWAAFDESGGTMVQASSPIEFSVSGDRLGSVALLEMSATSVRVRASSMVDGTYFDREYPLPDRAVVTNWYEYLYALIDRQSELVITDIPPISGSTYTVTVSGSGIVSLGTFVLGNRTEFGFTQYSASIGIIDYSRKDVDAFGRAQLARRRFSKRMDVQVVMDPGVTDSVNRLLADMRATVALFVAASGSYESLTIFGFYRDYNIEIAFPTQTLLSLQIEGISA